jgi:amino acid adenylation domain-containing protein
MVPASFAQQRLWFLDQLDPGNSTYNSFEALRLHGELDYEALQRCFTEIIRRHEVLRTTFVEIDGKPMQRINDFEKLPLRLVDVSHMEEPLREQEAQRLISKETQTPFDLQHEPLMRPFLVRLEPEEHLLLISVHHIAFDGWSRGILTKELSVLYKAFSSGQPSPLPELPIQYADYALWQQEWLKGAALERQLNYWKKQLEGSPSLLAFPTSRPRPVRQSYRGQTIMFALPRTLLDQLYRLCRIEGVTLFMVLAAAFKTLLCRYAQQEDMVIGFLSANRTHIEIEDLIGFFVNTLVLRTDLSGRPTFHEVLRRVRNVTLEAYDYQDVPFEQLVEALQPERNLSYTPLVQTLFVLQNGLGEAMKLGDISSVGTLVKNSTAPFDLTFDLAEIPSGLRGSLRYNSDIFDQAFMEQFVTCFRILLEHVVSEPEANIWEIPLLTENGSSQTLEAAADPITNLSEPRDFLDLFAAQVRRTPQALAACTAQERVSYQQLDARANRLATRLQALGVGPETRVALLAERGLALLSSLLAIFKVGAAYVPLDPIQPVKRGRLVLQASRASLLLTQEALQPRAQQLLEEWEAPMVPQIALLEEWEQGEEGVRAPAVPPLPHQLAYVLFTSGSTGQPKGVMIEQQGMLNHLLCKVKELGLQAGDRIAQTASQSFDISLWQLLAGLLVGGSIHILADEVSQDPQRLVEALEREQIQVVQVVPSLLVGMVEVLEEQGEQRMRLQALRWMVPTGEVLPVELCRRWLRLYPQIPLVNAYGPTEASDNVTHAVIDQVPDEGVVRVPIGKALSNMRLYVVGRYGEQVPPGAQGELYIGGKGVGRGYEGEGGKTAAAYVPDNFGREAGGRLYRTGDRVRMQEDGSLEFLGRRDGQVKVRGYRIEVGEIEEALRSQPGVREVVVQEWGEGEEKRLVAYLVGEVEVRKVKAGVQERLPEYMVPGGWVVLEELPLSQNGKVDRKQLEEPERGERGEEEEEPQTGVEEVLAGIWRELLKVERVSREADFFELGGHSLLATRMVAQVRRVLQVEVSLRAVFEAPTIASLAALILQH